MFIVYVFLKHNFKELTFVCFRHFSAFEELFETLTQKIDMNLLL